MPELRWQLLADVGKELLLREVVGREDVRRDDYHVYVMFRWNEEHETVEGETVEGTESACGLPKAR